MEHGVWFRRAAGTDWPAVGAPNDFPLGN